MDFSQLHTNFKNVVDSFDDIVVEVISQHEAELIDLNTGQLELGIAADGIEIEPQYAYDDYAQYKKAIGSKANKGTPDLKLEGDFYLGFKAKIEPQYIEISSEDSKAKQLESKYSKDIYGLTDKSKSEFAEIIKEPLKDKIYDQLTK